MLVAPKRLVERFVGLTQEEVTDLFVSAQKVCMAIEQEYKASSCTLAIQVRVMMAYKCYVICTCIQCAYIHIR